MPGVEGEVEIVDGRLPRPGDVARRLPPPVAAEYEGPRTTAVVEVMVQEEAASEASMTRIRRVSRVPIRSQPLLDYET